MKKRQLMLVVMLALLMPAAAIAGPAEEANAVVDRWSAAITSNDPDEVTKTYSPDAILLGTVSLVMFEGTEAIRKYFSPLKGSGANNVVGEKRTIVLSDDAAVVVGFYEFTGVQDGKAVTTPARFTMLIVKRDGVWRIAHHHSSRQPM
jgi:uncharacterized protein (TIGR02246 family)